MNYFLEDSNLYTLWVYSNPKFYPAEYFGVRAIAPSKTVYISKVFSFLAEQLEAAGVPFDSFNSYHGIDYKEMGMPPTQKDLTDYSAKERQKILDACKKFKAHDLTLKEINILEPLYGDIYEHLYLQPELNQTHTKKLNDHIAKYIDQFINNELFVYDRNYFAFEKQKQCFIKKVKEMNALENYGKNFIISESVPEDSKERAERGFLFIHTLLALQRLGYIEVLRLWYTSGGLLVDHVYNASIVVAKSFIDEIYSSYRKENPSNVIESFDAKRGTLRFAGREIELAKKGKETDAVLLLKTLLKADIDEWVHEDEILGDWGYNDDDRKDLPKNKVYFAGQKVNTAVELKTSISDFLECSTTKARINPKYRKIDE